MLIDARGLAPNVTYRARSGAPTAAGSRVAVLSRTAYSMICGSTYTASAPRWYPSRVSTSTTGSGDSCVVVIRSTTTYSCVAVG